MKISYDSPAGHPLDPDFPAHWTNITEGQSVKERSVAIMQNVNRDLDEVLQAAEGLSSRSMGPIEFAAGPPRLRDNRAHRVDHNLPAHWEGIEFGQTRDERSAAILVNIKRDELRKVSSSYRALARVEALRRRSLPS